MKVVAALRLGLSFFVQLVLANISVLRTVMQPRLNIRPGIVAYPLEIKSDKAITWLANMITLTPGTLTLDVSADRRTLFIHTLDIADASDVVESIKTAFERHLLELES